MSKKTVYGPFVVRASKCVRRSPERGVVVIQDDLPPHGIRCSREDSTITSPQHGEIIVPGYVTRGTGRAESGWISRDDKLPVRSVHSPDTEDNASAQQRECEGTWTRALPGERRQITLPRRAGVSLHCLPHPSTFRKCAGKAAKRNWQRQRDDPVERHLQELRKRTTCTSRDVNHRHSLRSVLHLEGGREEESYAQGNLISTPVRLSSPERPGNITATLPVPDVPVTDVPVTDVPVADVPVTDVPLIDEVVHDWLRECRKSHQKTFTIKPYEE